MKASTNQIYLIFTISLCIALLYLLAPILTPFLLGALLAYLVDPLVKKLEKLHIPHIFSVLLIFFLLFLGVTGLIIFLYPHVMNQFDAISLLIPQAVTWAQTVGMPWLMQFIDIDSIKSSLPSTLSKSGWVLSTFINSGFSAIRALVSIILTPVVTFYLLRDWDKIIANIKNNLPKAYASDIIRLAHECDLVLSAFIRGQLLVMLCLAFIYGIGLSIIGLKLGLMIGLIGGLLSIVPYLGSTFVLVSALIAAYMQYGFNSAEVPVVVVFCIGQAIEGYVLTPYLIGERIGLHPVAIIFAVMAGGTLFGFFGVLLALPVAAVLMATARFFRKRAVCQS